MDGRQADFEAVFEPGGIWTKLLYQADGYLGTEVRREVPVTRQYRSAGLLELAPEL
jgi:hypothetical protein